MPFKHSTNYKSGFLLSFFFFEVGSYVIKADLELIYG